MINQKSEFARNVGKRIRAERKKRGMTQLELSERSGLKSSFISQIENIESDKKPSVDSIDAIALAMGVTPAIFFDDDIQKLIQNKIDVKKLQKAKKSLKSFLKIIEDTT